MKARLQRAPRIGLILLCALAIVAMTVPFGLQLNPQAAGSTKYTHQEVDFEDPDLFEFADASALSLDGMPQQDGYLYGENLSDEERAVQIDGKVPVAGEEYTVGFDFFVTTMPAEGNKIFTVSVTDNGKTAVSNEMKETLYEEINRWYHYETKITPESTDVVLALALMPQTAVLFDNLAVTLPDGTVLALDGETAAGNALGFAWVLKNESVSTRNDNMALHIINPSVSKKGTSRYYSLNFNDGANSLSKVLVAKNDYKLRFHYYYVDNGYTEKDVPNESVKVRLANTATSTVGSLNTEFSLAESQPKFGNWYTFETTFTAKNRQTAYLTVEVGAGIELYIDNVEFIGADDKTVLKADFNTAYNVSVADGTPAATYKIEAGPALRFVEDWALFIRNAKAAPGTAYIEDYSLTEKLSGSKDYFLRMQTFIGKNAKDLIDTKPNTKNFEVLVGSATVATSTIGQLKVDEWDVYETETFKVDGAWLAIKAYSGLTAYFDNIEVVDANTRQTVLTYTIEKVNFINSTSICGEKVDRRTARAGMAKNTVLHINTPKKSKLDHVLDFQINLPDLSAKLIVGRQYKFTADMYYVDNGCSTNADGEHHTNCPTFRVGTGDGQYCEVFQDARVEYMGEKNGRPFDQWIKVEGGWYRNEHKTFTRMESGKYNIYYSSMGVKVWCGTEVYVDNMTIWDVETNQPVYVVDFEDELSTTEFDESISHDTPPPKGTFRIENGPEVVYGGQTATTDYSAMASANAIQIQDNELTYLETNVDYRFSFNYYMTAAAIGNELFEIRATKSGSDSACGFVGKVLNDDTRKTDRWEKACFVGKLSDLADTLTVVPAAGTTVYIDDIVVTDMMTNEKVAAVMFDKKTVVMDLSAKKSVGVTDQTPSKTQMVVTGEPAGVEMGYLRAIAGRDSAKSGTVGYKSCKDAIGNSLLIEPGCTYTVTFDYYQARKANSGNELFNITSLVAPTGANTPCLTVYGKPDGFWDTASFKFTVDEKATATEDFLQFNIAAGAAVYIDNLWMTKYLEDTNEELPKVVDEDGTITSTGIIDFEEADSVKYFKADEKIYRVTKSEIDALGFEGNGSNGYLYINNKEGNSAGVNFCELKNVKLQPNTNYAVTVNFYCKEDTGDRYAFSFGYQHTTPESEGREKVNLQYYNKIQKGWTAKTIYFSTEQLVPSKSYLLFGPYGGYDMLIDNITVAEVISPEPVKEKILDFDVADGTLYPEAKDFRRVTNAEIKALYPKWADKIGNSKGFLFGRNTDPCADRASNYDIHGIALRSNSVYNINFKYLVLEQDTNPEDGAFFGYYCALGTNYGKGGWNMRTFVNGIADDHQWRTMTLSIVTGEVEPDIPYFVTALYNGCAVLFDDFTVTDMASYDENLYCEDLYSQLENSNFESPTTDKDWGETLSDGLTVVSDGGDANRKANKNVLQADGSVLDGGAYMRRFTLVPNTNYILSAWVKAEPDSDVTVGAFATSAGKNFKDLFITPTGNLTDNENFVRDGKWHRVNIAFGTGIYDEGYLIVQGTNGKLWLDDVDLYRATQGTKSAELIETIKKAMVQKAAVSFKPTVTYEEAFVTETLYRKDKILDTWEETTEQKVVHSPEFQHRTTKTVHRTGGDMPVSSYIFIVAGGILLLSLAGFFAALLIGKKKGGAGK